jgi:Arabinose efflux permease
MNEANDGATKTWVLALTSAGSLMAVLDAMVVATALNTMRVDLNASIEALEWTMNAYSLSFAVLLLTGAALGDRFGRARMFVAGLVLFVAASVACALAGSVGWLIAARAVQGAGAALIMPIAMALLSATFPSQERARALGIFSGVTGLALIVGPVLGGAIAQGAAWQWIFWINIPIGLIVIPLAYRRIPESFGAGTAIDGTGVALVTGAALGLVFGLMQGNVAGWGSGEVLTVHWGGLLLAACFVVWELRARSADGADAALSLACLLVRRKRLLPLLCRNVWRSVFPAAVSTDRAGLRTARRGPALAAVDRDAVRGGAGRRQSRQPDRRAVPDRRRPHPAGHRNVLDCTDRSARSCVQQTDRALDPLGGRRFDGDARRTERGVELGRAHRGWQGVRHFSTCFVFSAASPELRSRSPCSRPPAVSAPPTHSRPGSWRRPASRRFCRSSGRSPACGSRRGVAVRTESASAKA